MQWASSTATRLGGCFSISERNLGVFSRSGATYNIRYFPAPALSRARSICRAVSELFRYAALTPACFSAAT